MSSKSLCRAFIFGPVLSLSVALASCSGPVPAGTNGPGGNGTGTGDRSGSGTGTSINLDPGATSTNVSTGTDVTEKDACVVKPYTATKQPANLLLILDRSTSMGFAMNSDETCGGGGFGGGSRNCQSRWAEMKTVLTQVLASSAGNVNWGLLLFSTPNESSCTVTSKLVQVPISATSADAIKTQISNNRNGPGGNTPTRDAVRVGMEYLKGFTGAGTKSILLATDGQPNCPANAAEDHRTDDDIKPATDAVQAARDAGFKVYVLGIGPSQFTSTLNGFAFAGGTEVKDVGGSGKNYYAAVSADELAKQFQSIVGSVSTCTLSLDTAPAASVPVVVEFDGNKDLRAPQDATNGWTYATPDRKTIQLNGSWCEGLTNGTYEKANVLVGCPGQINF